MFEKRTIIALICGLSQVFNAAGKAPDMIPMPKTYKQTGGSFALSSRDVYISPNNRQCQIAADEISARIKELGGIPGKIKTVDKVSNPGIYILTVSDKTAESLKSKYKLSVTKTDPGPQGYIIHTAGNQLIVIGSDNVGTLYGAMTLRQMMRKAGNGKVDIANADVYDKPDYRYRSKMSFRRGLARWAAGLSGKRKEEAFKAGIDWMMRFKLNITSDYLFPYKDACQIPAAQKAFISKINRYAVERGIYPSCWFHTNVANLKVDKGAEFKNWDGIRTGDMLFSWARDDLAEKKIKQSVRFCKDGNFKILFLHPVDGGGITDPECWSKRGKLDRQRWKDNERWKASVHQYNMWAKEIKKVDPGLIFTSPVYPYVASAASITSFPGIDPKVWKQNTIDYWKKVNEHIDPILIPQTWMAQRSLMKKYRSYFKGRPVQIYAHSFIPTGYFGTWHRLDKTNYDGNPRDIFTLEYGLDKLSRWLNVICTGEYTWNTNAPGSENYTGLYYDAEKDHTGPKVMMDEWVPRACRAFYGEEAGSQIVPVYTAGVQPVYIVDPGYGMYLMNKMRRKPLADVDPTKKAEQTIGKAAAKDLEDSPERMEFQMKATKKAMTALDKTYPYLDSIGKYPRKNFMYFYKRMPLWYMIARARYACYVASDLQRRGMFKKSAAILEKGLENFKKDWAYAKDRLEKTRRDADLTYRGPLGFNMDGKGGDVGFPPQKVKQMLEEQLSSARIVLNPRKTGPLVNIGIYKGAGAKGTKEFFDQFKNAKAEIIDSLALAVIDKYNCIFILQSRSVNKKDYFLNLQRYVKEGGGGVLFQHDMCGFKRSIFGCKTPFPDICPGAQDRADAFILKVMKAHPVVETMKKGDTMRHMYYDHINPEPGKKAVVILADQKGKAVVIAGKDGYGKVVFDGNVNLTAKDKDKILMDINAVIAQGAVEWFTGTKLIRK